MTKPGRAERSTGRPKTSADVDDGPRHSSSRGEPAPTNRRPSQRVAADASPTVDMARGVYAISVVAELVGIDQQSLRLYERRGLLHPSVQRKAPAATAATTSTGCTASSNSFVRVSTSPA